MDNTKPLNEINRKVIVIVFIIGAFVTVLNQTLLVTALPHIMRSFNITADKGQWLTTVFMLVNGIFIPVTAFLIEKYSTRKLFMAFMGIFTVGTLIAAFAPSFSILLLGRILQAIGAGGIMPLMQTVFLVIFPKEKRGMIMGMMGLVIAFAPAIGPALSGWIVDSFSWNHLFYVILPIAIIDIIAAAFTLKNVTETKKIKLDILSVILSSVGFGGILYGFSTAGSNGWSDKWVIVTILVGIISMLLFVYRQLKSSHPLLELRVFKNRTFAITTILSMIAFASMMGLETILPMYTQNLRNVSAFHSGAMLLPGAIIMGIMSPITGMMFDRVGAKLIGIMGFSILTATTFFFAFLNLQTSLTFIVIVYAIRMAGIAMVMMPLVTAGVNALPNNLIAHATAVNNTFSQVSGSIGTAVLITVMTSVAKNNISTNPLNSTLHGMDSAFLCSAILAFAGLILIFALKNDNKNEKLMRKAG